MAESAYGEIKVRITFCRPVLLHNTPLIDPTHPWSREIKELQAKKKKLGKKQDTSDLEAQMLKLQYIACAYWDEEADCFYMPSENIERAIREGAARNKLGKQVEAGLTVLETNVPFQGLDDLFNGPPKKLKPTSLADLEGVKILPVPRTLEKIYDENYALPVGYVLKRPVRIPPRTGARVMLHRPMIPVGAFLEFTIQFDKSIITDKAARVSVEEAGKFIGLGTWRPKFGRFGTEFVTKFTEEK